MTCADRIGIARLVTILIVAVGLLFAVAPPPFLGGNSDHHRAARRAHHARDGRITQAECRAVKKGTPFDGLIDRYGRPRGQSYADIDLWGLWYPVRDARDGTTCQLDDLGGDAQRVHQKTLDISL